MQVKKRGDAGKDHKEGQLGLVFEGDSQAFEHAGSVHVREQEPADRQTLFPINTHSKQGEKKPQRGWRDAQPVEASPVVGNYDTAITGENRVPCVEVQGESL